MNASQEPIRPRKLRFDFSQVEKELNSVCDRANLELSQLVTPSQYQVFQNYTLVPYLRSLIPASTPTASSKRIQFQLRLGSTRLTLEELKKLHPDVVVPLLDATNGQIQIWSHGRLIGHGVLRIADGKLVVKIVSLEKED